MFVGGGRVGGCCAVRLGIARVPCAMTAALGDIYVKGNVRVFLLDNGRWAVSNMVCVSRRTVGGIATAV